MAFVFPGQVLHACKNLLLRKGIFDWLMLGKGRLLLTVAAGSLLLVFASAATVLGREKPHYWPEGTPLAAAHNYLLAFKQDDLARAYTYLSPTMGGYPTIDEFVEQISRGRGEHLSFAIMLELNDVGGQEPVMVRVWERRFLGGSLELMFGPHEGVHEGIYGGRDHIPEDVLDELLNRDWENNGPFIHWPTKSISNGHFTRSFEMYLQQENGAWKIVDSQNYWNHCWDQAEGCE